MHKHISKHRKYLFAPPLDAHLSKLHPRDAPLRKAIAASPETFVNLRSSKHVSRATLLDAHEHSWRMRRNTRKTTVFIDSTVHVWANKQRKERTNFAARVFAHPSDCTCVLPKRRY